MTDEYPSELQYQDPYRKWTTEYSSQLSRPNPQVDAHAKLQVGTLAATVPPIESPT